MSKLTVLEEIRKFRDQIARKFNYDAAAIVEDAKKREEKGEVVSCPKKKQAS